MKYTIIIASLFIFLSCTYNKDELPKPKEIETTSVVTYTNFVKNMIENNHCLECHVAGGEAAFRNYTTYSGIKSVAVSGALKSRAIDNIGVSMPKGYPPLEQSIKDTLQMWIDQGALE